MGLYVDICKKLNKFSLDVTFETHGDALAIFGASGSGKSMILKCIAGIERPDSGKIVFDGKVLFDSEAKINIPSRERGIGYLFQNYALFPNMTVRENIMISNRITEEELQELLIKFDMTELANEYPRRMSGGQQQRAAICRMLAAKPKMLLFDEPFSAIDEQLKLQLYKVLFNNIIRDHKYNFLVSHNFREVYNLSDKILCIDAGKQLAFADIKELYHAPTNEKVAALLGYKNIEKVNKGKIETWDYSLSERKDFSGKICVLEDKIQIAAEREGAFGFDSYEVLNNFKTIEVVFKKGNREMIGIFTEEDWEQKTDPFYLKIEEKDLVYLRE